MAGELTVRAGWALWSKQAGTRNDYSIIACSGEPFDRAAFTEIITRFAVGTPDSTATGPGALPWGTVSWVGVDASLHLGIAITDRTGQVDGVGRPIAQTSYYCVPYAPLASAAEKYKTPVSYGALLKAVAGEPLQPRDGGSITLGVEPVPAEALASVVHRFGEQFVASTAALLLTGPVGVIGAEGTSLRERLDFIDAVASLLPYGYRTKFSAATWSQGGTRHRVRLAFGSYPREDGATVTWRRGAEPGALRDKARVYFDLISRLTGGPASAVSLPAVIGHFASDAAPRRFEQPQDAIDSLNQLDQPFRALRAIRDRTGADLADLRQVLRLGRARELPTEADQVALVAELAGRGEAQDWKELRREISKLRAADDRVRILTAFGHRMLWATVPADVGVAQECLRLASDLGAEDAVLAGLVRSPDNAADLRAGRQAAAELLAGVVVNARRDYPRTRDALAGDGGTTVEYLAALSRVGRAGGLLRWLDPQGASALSRAFRAALGIDEGWVSEADLGELDAGGADSVRVLLHAASKAGHLDKVLPGFTNWLAGCGELQGGTQSYWITNLSGLVPGGPRSQAWLDTALLMVGGLPSGLPPAQWKAAVIYADAMAGTWSDLGRAYPLFDADVCARALAGYLGEQQWTTTPEQAVAVIELVKRLHEADQGGHLLKAVAFALAATPTARSWDFARDWLAWAADNDPEAARGRLLDSLAVVPPGTDPDDIARLCADACAEGIDPDTALGQLVKSGPLTGATQAIDLLHALLPRFGEAGIDEDSSLAWYFVLSELLARGELGKAFLPELRATLSREYRRDIRSDLRGLAIWAGDGRERQYEWTDDEREELADIAATVGSMLKRSRKLPFQKGRRSLPAGGGHEEAPEGQVSDGEAGFAAGPADTLFLVGPEQDRPLGMQDTVTMPPRPQ